MDETLVPNAEKFAALKSRKADIENTLDEVNKEISALSLVMLQTMVNTGVEKFKTADGTFYIHRQERARILPDAEAVAFAFLREAGVGHVIKETVNHNTLTSVYKELAESKLIDPISCTSKGIGVFVDESVRIRKQ